MMVPANASAARPVVSESVGCGWMVSAMPAASAPHLDRMGDLGDELPGVRPGDAGADEASGGLGGQQFGQAFVPAQGQRAAAGGPREDAMAAPVRGDRPAHAAGQPVQVLPGGGLDGGPDETGARTAADHQAADRRLPAAQQRETSW